MIDKYFSKQIILVALTGFISFSAGSSNRVPDSTIDWKTNFSSEVVKPPAQGSFSTSNLTIAFIKADINKIRDTLINWQRPIAKKQNNNSISSEKLKGDIYSAWQQLLPLTTVEIRRYLLVPTNSQWVALIDNSSQGTDQTCPSEVARRLKAKMIYISCNRISGENVVSYQADIQGRYQLVRSIAVSIEDGWQFYQYGKPLPFEQRKNYQNKIIKSRFTFPQLNNFLKHFGIAAFDNKFYMPAGTALLIKKTGPMYPWTKEIPR